jgi:dihydroorotase
LGSIIKINPSVCDREDQEALYQGLSDGTIDIVATDHSPLPVEERVKENIWEATAGFCGFETILSLMLTEVHCARLSITDLVHLTSENLACAYSLYPKKGAIKVGSDADLDISGLDKQGEIRAKRLHSKTKVTPFVGSKAKGCATCTLVDGHVVMKDGEIDESRVGRMVV